MVALSTDKAVNPVNLYGATKLCADKLFVAGNSYVGSKQRPRISVVRYGNVLGSRGSIIPFLARIGCEWRQTLPVTDSRMTRFWITLDQSVTFVMNSLRSMKGGEIFVPKIPSMKITDLANALAPHLPLEHCGIRPGEKLHELLIAAEDARNTLEFGDHFVIQSQSANYQSEWQRYSKGEGEPVASGFHYGSETNKEWLSVPMLRKLIGFPEALSEVEKPSLEEATATV